MLNIKRLATLDDPNVRYCPNKNCDCLLDRPSKKQSKYVTCKNGHNYYFNCLKPWHGERQCSDESDRQIQQ